MLLLEGHTAPVFSVAYAPDSVTLASGGADRTVILWDLTTGRSTHTLKDVGGPVLSLAFSPDGLILAVGTGSRVRMFNLTTGKSERSIGGRLGGTYTVSFIPLTGHMALCGYLDSNILVYNCEGDWKSLPKEGHRSGVLALATCADRPWLLSGGGFPNWGDLCLWDTTDLAFRRKFEEFIIIHGMRNDRVRLAHQAAVYSVALSPCGRLAASGSKDRLVKLWDVEKYVPPVHLFGHECTVVAVAFTPDGSCLLSADEQGKICIWDVATHRLRQCMDWQVGNLRSVVFAPNGMTAAAGGRREVIVWDIDE